MHKVALFAIVFASLAPSISHALASQQAINSFSQAICTTDGEIITIQVLTSKGQQLSTTFSAEERTPSSGSILNHLNHCPFCSNSATSVSIEPPQTTMFVLLAAKAQHLAISTQVVLTRLSVLPPPAQAPPQL